MDSHEPQGATGQKQSPDQSVRRNVGTDIRGSARRIGNPDSIRADIWATWSSKPKIMHKAFGDKVLIDDLSFRLPAGGIVGIIGPNGAGKTTLFRMMTGQDEPDSGTIRVGDTVDLGYVDQSRDSLQADNTVFEEISGGTRNDRDGRPQNQRPSLRGSVQLQRPRSGKESRQSVRRRTQPRSLGQTAPPRLQRVAAGRTDQRLGRRYACGHSKKRSPTSPAASS